MIAVFVNPHSRANRRNPRLAAEFAGLVGDTGRVLVPAALDELRREAEALRAENPTMIAVHGGDGSLHKTLTALVEAWGGAPLPPIATLCGGTMNVVAGSLGLRERPHTFLRYLAACARAGRPPATIRRRCMQVGDQFGFVFGNGLMANFLDEYYARGGYGPGRAAWLLFRALCSAMWGGPFVRRIFRRFRGRVSVDGTALEWPSFTAVGAATVREVGLGFKLNHRADDDPERLGVLAIHAGPLGLVPELPAVHAGRGIRPSRAYSSVASLVEMVPDEARMLYTIDGDLYSATGPLRVALGPRVEMIKPERAGRN